MKNKNTIIHIIQILIIAIFIISLVPKEFQNDTFFSIALGENYLKEGINEKEQLVWHEGLEYTNSRWLFDITITKLYNIFGFDGIYIFVIIFAIIQGILFYYIINKITHKKFFAFAFTVLIMKLVSAEFTARAQVISFALFILEFISIYQVIENNKNIYIIYLLAISILLANFHASVFPMYFVFYLPYIAEYILSKLKLKSSNNNKLIIEKRNIKKILTLVILGFLLSFCTPKGVYPYSDIFNVVKGISSSFISELQPLTINSGVYLICLISTVFAIIAFTNTKVRCVDGLYILGFCLLALSTERCIFFFYLISSICIARIINDLFDNYNVNFNFISKKYKIFTFGLITAFLLINSSNRLFRNLMNDYVNPSIYPVSATDYILNSLDVSNLRIYNGFNFGSYLELRGVKAFIDSRSGIYTEEFNPGTTILKDWYNITYGSENYKKIFDKYQITHALLYNTELINLYICNDPNWKIIYQDDIFSLYENVRSSKEADNSI